MLNLNKIELDFETRREVFSEASALPHADKPEMSEFESAFLCGLIKKFKPKKILEVGVAAGGTTAIILNRLEKNAQPYIMKSVDILRTVWNDSSKHAGYLATTMKNNLQVGTHEFYLGTTLPFVIDEIGGDIDFLVLDTTHSMPGENLDFLTALPYLKENAVVCMHDVSLNQRDLPYMHFHATAALFSAVTANKFLNLVMNDNLSFNYPNIAAFQINSDTMKNIENVFLTLVLRWKYLPSQKNLWGYANMFSRHYPQEMFAIFMETLKLNVKSLMDESRINAQKK